jgi:hypothetical protein
LYLARKIIQGQRRYFIRESYREKGCLRSRDLYDLGANPERYIRYPGGNSYYIDDSVEEAITAAGSKSTLDELDDIFWDFLKPEIRRKLEVFRRRELVSRSAKCRPPKKSAGSYHVFDKHRIYYLKCGRIDQSGLGWLPAKMFHILNDKSRDEIEQKFIEMERILRSSELKSYVYSIFDLQKFFAETFAKSSPHILNQTKVDGCFLKELCRLNDDHAFWNGMEKDDKLHEYLVRYAVMLFDFDYQPRSFMEAYIRNFIDNRRDYRPPAQKRSVTSGEASTIFNVSKEALDNMGRSDLARLYRRLAQKLHPDKGGDHDKFVKLTEAYHHLLGRKL